MGTITFILLLNTRKYVALFPGFVIVVMPILGSSLDIEQIVPARFPQIFLIDQYKTKIKYKLLNPADYIYFFIQYI